MTLTEFCTQSRLQILDALSRGQQPPMGEFSEQALKEAQLRGGSPQLGAIRYHPSRVVFEFIYPATGSSNLVFSVSLDPPERIVYLPVPGWVVQSIWQGEVLGSYRFESEANALVEAFRRGLEPAENAAHFGEDAGSGGRGS